MEDRVYFDRASRPWRSAHKESSTQWSVKDTKYDDLSRMSETSNPYFLTTITDPPTTSSIWTAMTYDALGRVLTVTTPDSAVVTTGYSGNEVTVTDQASKVRRSVTDGLGRLKQVVEDPSGSLNYTTNYTYSTMGDLIKVEQGSQYRYFLYDSLSRLLRAKNPEQDANTNIALTPPSDQSTGNTAWALKYVYDSNGNLTSKVDPRNVTTSYGYDAINRNVAVSYNDSVTPTIERYYDKHPNASQNGKGRLYYNVVYRYEGGNPAFLRTIVDQYDAVGRPQTQSFYSHSGGVWQDYTSTMSYDLAGNPTGEGYPASRSISTSDSLSGRISGLRTNSTTLLSDMSYEAFGGLASEKYAAGNNLIHAMTYNNRLQPSEIKLGTSGTPDSIFKLSYIYGTASSPTDADGSILTGKNNGNVGRIKYTISGTLQYSQTYQYDGVNRLSYGVEHNNGTLSDPNRAWYQTFAYDRWGNRGMTVGSTSSNLNQGGNALELADFSSSTNRISETGYTFDNAGNLTAEPGSKTYEYDGENKIKKATASSTDSYYWYDADGRRVKKVVGGTATRFVYNASGQLIAEYTDAGSLTKEYVYKGGTFVATIEPTDVVKYATADHLGTPRVWTNSSGGVVSRHDYAPFGEELFSGVGVRTTGAGWPSSAQADGQRKQFTSKERDGETGLDYSGARYYSMLGGRFNGVDPFDPSALQSNPQTWNRYSYVLNRPLAALDPDGLLTIIIGGTFNGSAKGYGEGTPFAAAVEKSFGDRTKVFEWNGSLFGRRQAAKKLLKFIQEHRRSGEPLNIIAHSHGGSVVKAYTQLAGADDIDVFIALGTPQRPEYKTKKGKVKQHYNVYSENDNVQLNAGPFWMLFGAGRRDGSATNIEISQVGGNPVSHSDLHTVEVWDALWSAINTNAAPSQSQPNPTPGSEDDPGVQDIRRGYSLPGHKNPAKEAEEIYLYRLQKTLDEKNKKKKGEKENM